MHGTADDALRSSRQGIRLNDQPDWVNEIIDRTRPYTLTPPERVAELCHSVEYVCKANIPGAIVECGVWRGGSMMAAALALMRCGPRRGLWLYDTFEGMPPPQDVDRKALTGEKAADIMARVSDEHGIWCRCGVDEVWHNLESTEYLGTIRLVKGLVEQTIPNPENVPSKIALLRLDTDWYASTLHELTHLYPLLAIGGVLIIDDYGHWEGSHKAVDEYFRNIPILFHRIDWSCRVAVKMEK